MRDGGIHGPVMRVAVMTSEQVVAGVDLLVTGLHISTSALLIIDSVVDDCDCICAFAERTRLNDGLVTTDA